MTAVLLFLVACIPPKRASHSLPQTEPIGLLELLELSSENIKYAGQGRCRPKDYHKLFTLEPARLMFFESEAWQTQPAARQR